VTIVELSFVWLYVCGVVSTWVMFKYGEMLNRAQGIPPSEKLAEIVVPLVWFVFIPLLSLISLFLYLRAHFSDDDFGGMA